MNKQPAFTDAHLSDQAALLWRRKYATQHIQHRGRILKVEQYLTDPRVIAYEFARDLAADEKQRHGVAGWLDMSDDMIVGVVTGSILDKVYLLFLAFRNVLAVLTVVASRVRGRR